MPWVGGENPRFGGEPPERPGEKPWVGGEKPGFGGQHPGIPDGRPRLFDETRRKFATQRRKFAGQSRGDGKLRRLSGKPPGPGGTARRKFRILIGQQSVNHNQNREAKRMPGTVIEMDAGWFMDAGLSMDDPAPSPVPVTPPPPVHKKKGKAMDFVPPKRDARYQWYKNLSSNVVAEGVKMGVPAADALAVKALADAIIAKYDATNTAQTALDGLRQIESTTEAADLAQIRAKVRNWKTLANYPGSGSEAVLQLKGADSAFDPTTYKPVIKLSLVPGGVRVGFVKKGVDGVAIYMRVAGTTLWRKVGMDTESPFTDTTPLAAPGVPEVREYMARGVLHDEELPLDSDPAIITFAG
jgi:hypothetical protein